MATRSRVTGRFISRAASRRRRNLKLYNPGKRRRKARRKGRILRGVYVRERSGGHSLITSFKPRKYYRRTRKGGRRRYAALANPRKKRRRKGRARVWYGKRKKGSRRRRKLFGGRPRRIYRRRRKGGYAVARNARRRGRRRRKNYTRAYLMNPRRSRRRRNASRRRGRRRARRNPFSVGGLSLRSITGPVMNVGFWKDAAVGAVGVVATEVVGNQVLAFADPYLPAAVAQGTFGGGIVRAAVKVGVAAGLSVVARRFVGDSGAKAILIGAGVLAAKDILSGLGVFSALGLGAYATEEYGLRAYATEEYGLRGKIPGVGLGGMIPGVGLGAGDPLQGYYEGAPAWQM